MSIQPERFYPAWTLGDRIRKARLSTGMNQRDFAPLIGVKPGSLASWEADNSQPRDIVAVAKRIEVLTRIPAAWLLSLDDTPPSPNGGGAPSAPIPADQGSLLSDLNRRPHAYKVSPLPAVIRRAA